MAPSFAARAQPAEPITFTYCRIPADPAVPVEQLTATTSAYGDQLAESILAPAFAGGRVLNTRGLAADYGSAVVDQKMEALKMAAALGTVEVFALMRPSPTTQPVAHSGVYLYLDEMGVLKNRPLNERASSLARQCGIDVESPFHGDIFVGRVVLSPSPTRNASFALAELDSGSAFMRCVAGENHAYRQAAYEYDEAVAAKRAASADPYGGEPAPGREYEAGGIKCTDPNPKAYGDPEAKERGFWWKQDVESVEVTCGAPKGTKKNDLSITIKPSSLKIVVKASTANEEETLCDLALYANVRPEGCTWTVGTETDLRVLVEVKTARRRPAAPLAPPDLPRPGMQVTLEKVTAITWSGLEGAPDGYSGRDTLHHDNGGVNVAGIGKYGFWN